MVNSFVGWVPIGVIIDAILFGSALLAIAAARFLPEHHLSPETKGVVTVSAAIVGTLSALVVGLLISTSSASFTAKSQQVTQISADVISLAFKSTATKSEQ
jgi:cellobiose-specific phosphotransferase system component IIC